jgi:pimeloyl-ACP methyl ester carboxylesterase
MWKWRGFDVRYQSLGEEHESGPAVLFVHGLFVNADHWRRNLPVLAEAGCRCYAIDLLGYGYSSKPFPTSDEARAVSGENGRSLGAPLSDVAPWRLKPPSLRHAILRRTADSDL